MILIVDSRLLVPTIRRKGLPQRILPSSLLRLLPHPMLLLKKRMTRITTTTNSTTTTAAEATTKTKKILQHTLSLQSPN
jgi:hypothetical protein